MALPHDAELRDILLEQSSVRIEWRVMRRCFLGESPVSLLVPSLGIAYCLEHRDFRSLLNCPLHRLRPFESLSCAKVWCLL